MNRVRRVIIVSSICWGIVCAITWAVFRGRFLAIPILLAFLTGLYIFIWTFSRRMPEDPGGVIWHEEQLRRVRLGLCLNCGYDLRGNRAGRCPECGRAVADKPESG